MIKHCLQSLVLVFVVSLSVAQAKEMNTRKGFFIGLSLGGGSLNLDDGIYTKGAGIGGLRIGGGVSERILLMAETHSAVAVEGDVTLTHASMNVSSQFFLGQGFYIRPGIGVASMQLDGDVEGFSFSASSETGFNVLLSSGYEFRLGQYFALAPEFNVTYSSIEKINVVHYGLAAALQWYF